MRVFVGLLSQVGGLVDLLSVGAWWTAVSGWIDMDWIV